MDEAAGIGLSSALEALRQELCEAWVAGADARIRFRVSDVTLVVEVVARRETTTGGKLRWWLFEAAADRTHGSEMTHTLTLQLTPQIRDHAGGYGPLDVHGEQDQPGG
jgi:hypothetical protein